MGRKYVVSIKKNNILYFFMIIPFIPIDCLFNVMPIWSTVFSYARILVIIFLLLRLFFVRRRFTMTLGLALLFFGGGFFSTFLANISFYTLLYYSSFLFGFTLLIEDGVYFDVDAFISGCLIWYEMLIYANFIYYILRPSGYGNSYYLFGNYNTTLRYVFPGLILGAIYAFKQKERVTLRFCCMFIVVLYFLIRVGSMTSIFSISIFMVAILFYMWRKKSGIFKFEFFIILSIGITFLVAILGRFNLFENFITLLLGKDMTLSGRTEIWARTLLEISKKTIWGHGELTSEITRGLIGGTDPHNMYLGILFYNGVIGLVILSIILLVILRRVRNGRKNCSEIAMIFDAGFCAYFILWTFEPCSEINEFYKIFIVFVMAYYCMDFEKGIKEFNNIIIQKT